MKTSQRFGLVLSFVLTMGSVSAHAFTIISPDSKVFKTDYSLSHTPDAYKVGKLEDRNLTAESSCVSEAREGLETEGVHAYNKVRGFLPDLFCCDERIHTGEQRLKCLTGNVEKISKALSFLQADFYFPLLVVMKDNSAFVGGVQNDLTDPVENKVERIRSELNTIGAIIDEFAGYVIQLKKSPSP